MSVSPLPDTSAPPEEPTSPSDGANPVAPGPEPVAELPADAEPGLTVVGSDDAPVCENGVCYL